MSTRRDALRILAATSASLPALAGAQENKEASDQPGHFHTGADSQGSFSLAAHFLSTCRVPHH